MSRARNEDYKVFDGVRATRPEIVLPCLGRSEGPPLETAFAMAFPGSPEGAGIYRC